MRYHIREGKHNITPEDWKHSLDFADHWLAKTVKNSSSRSAPKATSRPSRQKQIPSSSSSRREYHWNKARFAVGEVAH